MKYDVDSLIQEYSKKIYNLAYRIMGNPHDAEDVVQETFLSVHQNLDKFEGRSAIYTWIYRIALNKCFAHKKKQNKVIQRSFDDSIERDNVSIPDDIFEPHMNSTERQILLDELTRDVKQKCHYFVTFRLSDEQRIVFLLRYILHLSYKDIALILEVSQGVVKSRLNRSRNRLKSHFQKKCHWYDSKNTCKCENKLGYILMKYPGIIQNISKNRDIQPEYKKIMADQIQNRFQTVDEFYKNMPELEYKVRSLEEYILKK